MSKITEAIGRTRTTRDLIRVWPVEALALTLEDRIEPSREGDSLPPLRHWLHFLPLDPLSQAGPDGHARTGEFLPDTGLPRRMWAGGRLTFHRPLKIGEQATRVSRIENVEEKEGRSGRLVFVSVLHEISGADGLAISEEQDIVYREAPKIAGAAIRMQEAPSDPAWRRTVSPDPVMLFRYSALTFNSHRIHYDHPYVTGVEGYPGLVVHGPLLATLMADLACRENPGRTLRHFSFRGMAPVFAGEAFEVAGKPDGKDGAELWIAKPEGLAMQGRAEFT
ncbi:3-methylfumaryl-CoA hydratase [Mesorhizobium sp. J18]|uniref:FAS1-like dehydratase domain-containing protein n=1 Tax=Mesorhizobium sp. J18 TaxID=935263 RepID=UPI00119A5E3E|nr:MaoC family dehydratase N-terminal domain-containing protein [Mesorhizobium sp. J18]TWG93882.1 3-methylfumaryl-CoA hydratase [Mesorhizobium sp. J18]